MRPAVGKMYNVHQQSISRSWDGKLFQTVGPETEACTASFVLLSINLPTAISDHLPCWPVGRWSELATGRVRLANIGVQRFWRYAGLMIGFCMELCKMRDMLQELRWIWWMWCCSYPVCNECGLLCWSDGTTHADTDTCRLYPCRRCIQQSVQHLFARRYSAVRYNWWCWWGQGEEWQILWQGSTSCVQNTVWTI